MRVITMDMRVMTLNRAIVIVITLGSLLLGCAANSSVGEARQKNNMSLVASSEGESAASNRTPEAAAQQTNDAVTEWNQHAVNLTLLPASALTPIQQTRVMAIVQVAVHDAVNGITRKYETYLSPRRAPADSSPDAAAIAAAHYALRNLFMSQADQVALLDSRYLVSLAAHGISANDPGLEYGRSAAAAILAARANDGSAQAQYDYNAPGAGSPGVWVRLNNAPAQLPGWGNVTPFVLHSSSQFRPDAPPALGSRRYTEDYNEIKVIGVVNSPTRTAEQTQIAQFWRASPTAIWNPVITQVIATRHLNLSAKARAFALFYLASADAGIACWEAKYFYNFWRPQLAIRGGDVDGNDLTVPDANWLPLVPTPPHPEYPSGHATNSAAMATIIELLFGDEPEEPIVVTLSGITREWDTFEEAVDEVIDARVFSGIHFRNSDEVGAKLGSKVARFTSTHALRRCKKAGHGRCL